jgi:hypothetical protein
MFKYKNNNLVNEKGKVIEVQGGVDAFHRNIGVNRKNNEIWQ